MFDMKEIGRRISQMRRERNMTQLELADRLSISYQAVSNWERGNSMPDIEKLPELADIFSCSIDDILGHRSELIDSALRDDVSGFVKGHAFRAEEITEAMPLLKPEQVDRLVRVVKDEHFARMEERMRTIGETLSRKMDQTFGPHTGDGVADALQQAVDQADAMEPDRAETELSRGIADPELEAMLPFMRAEDVREFAEQYEKMGLPLTGFLPFLEEKEVARLAMCSLEEGKGYARYLPFLNGKDLETLLAEVKQRGGDTTAFLPFLSEDAVFTMAQEAIQRGDGAEKYLPFLNEEHVAACARKTLDAGRKIHGFLPFLSGDDLYGAAMRKMRETLAARRGSKKGAEMNIRLVVESGLCIGCGACAGCEAIEFETGDQGFPVPKVTGVCSSCGRCLENCDQWEGE